MQSEPQFGKYPRALGQGSVVGVISPASCVESSALNAGCDALSKLSGWRIEMSATALERDGDFAGSSVSRAAALTEMWLREDVDAIICSRGGYGTNYLLPLLDFDALKLKPKAFVGCSDNTSLLLALDRAGIVAFHGPMIASDFAQRRADASSFLSVLRGEALDLAFSAGSNVKTLIAGEALGPITGGCLSLVVTSLGTPWEIDASGKILFLEDVAEKPFRIDRMLMHLLLARKFEGVRGIVFGEMLRCSPDSVEEESLPQMIDRILGGLGIPIVYGFPSGHVESGNITLPFGVPAFLQCSESGVRLQVQPSTLIEHLLNARVSDPVRNHSH